MNRGKRKSAKYYVVWEGRTKGVFQDWESCGRSIAKYPGAKFKSYPTLFQARFAFENGREAKQAPKWMTAHPAPVLPCLVVDASCRGSPGPTEYRGVMLSAADPNGAVAFSSPVFPVGTNNMGEWLGVVHGLTWTTDRKLNIPVYSDSAVAIKWAMQCYTNCTMFDRLSQDLKDATVTARNWLRGNRTALERLRKWDTDLWGEIPADYGRK